MLESPTSARSLEGVCLDVVLKLKDLIGVGGEVELKMTERNRVYERRWHKLDSPLLTAPREARGKGFVSRQRQIQSDFRFHVPNPLGWTDIRNNSKIKSAAGR